MDRTPEPSALQFHVISEGGGVSKTIGHLRILNLGKQTL